MASVLVVGAGSIGRRHINNLLTLGAQVAVYPYRGSARSGAEAVPERATVVDDLNAALARPFDAAVIANRTDLHLPVALAAAHYGRNLFVEKPLSDSLAGVTELIEIARARRLVVESGFMLRFHPNLIWLKRFIEGCELGTLHYARASVGQFLPDWRPGIDYRQSYSARRRFGGGVIFDLVHELDLIRWLLGEVAEVAAFTHYSAVLEIETEAVAHIGMRLASGVLVQVNLDYLRPGYSRTLEIVGSRGTVAWDYVAGTVSLNVPARQLHRVPPGFERNDLFRAHMQHFLGRVTGGVVNGGASLDDGVAALRLALACHRSAEERRFINPGAIDAGYRVVGVAA